jgi:uncharacterized damage-inducible protein DinB
MKKILIQYISHNIWANQIIIKEVKKLSKAELNTEFVGSFSTILKTIEHLWMAEAVWNQRLKLVESIVIPTDNYSGEITDLIESWQKESQQLLEFANKQYNDEAFTHQVVYTRQKAQSKLEVGQILLHVCNHASFHRGQIINYLRGIGKTTIPNTDFSSFCLK